MNLPPWERAVGSADQLSPSRQGLGSHWASQARRPSWAGAPPADLLKTVPIDMRVRPAPSPQSASQQLARQLELEKAIATYLRDIPLLSALGEDDYHRVARTWGGEWAGPCPLCGGVDRLRVWPTPQEGRARAWCRQCKVTGDTLWWAIVRAGEKPGESGATAAFLRQRGYLPSQQVSYSRPATEPAELLTRQPMRADGGDGQHRARGQASAEGSSAGQQLSDSYAAEERAAIMESDAGLPRMEAERRAGLQPAELLSVSAREERIEVWKQPRSAGQLVAGGCEDGQTNAEVARYGANPSEDQNGAGSDPSQARALFAALDLLADLQAAGAGPQCDGRSLRFDCESALTRELRHRLAPLENDVVVWLLLAGSDCLVEVNPLPFTQKVALMFEALTTKQPVAGLPTAGVQWSRQQHSTGHPKRPPQPSLFTNVEGKR